jgi:hypothetical protein
MMFFKALLRLSGWILSVNSAIANLPSMSYLF